MLDFFKISAGGSALEWGSRGREFESRHSDHIDNLLLRVVDFFFALYPFFYYCILF